MVCHLEGMGCHGVFWDGRCRHHLDWVACVFHSKQESMAQRLAVDISAWTVEMIERNIEVHDVSDERLDGLQALQDVLINHPPCKPTSPQHRFQQDVHKMFRILRARWCASCDCD